MITQRRKGQALTEYIIVFAIVAAAVIGAQLLVNRGLKARVKDGVDLVTSVTGTINGTTNNYTLNTTSQYEPYYLDQNLATNSSTSVTENFQQFGKINRTNINDSTSRSGNVNQGVDLGADVNWH